MISGFLQLVGLVAVIYLAVKFLPDFVWFFVKFVTAGFIIFLTLLFMLTIWANYNTGIIG